MKKFLFSVCAVLAIFGCGGDRGDLPDLGDDGGKVPYYEPDKSSSSVGYSGSYGSVYYEGKTYKTVQIGTQTWMAENLNYNASGSKCYSNSESNCNTYGRLYDWSTAMGFASSCNSNSCSGQIQSKHRGICPSGWHIPTQAEWNTLSSYVQSNSGCSSCDARLLKSTSGWSSYGNGTNKYGFSALPGGYGYSGGSFNYVGYGGYWWSASELDSPSLTAATWATTTRTPTGTTALRATCLACVASRTKA